MDPMGVYIYIHTLWLFNIAMEHGPFIDDKHDDLPIKNKVIPMVLHQGSPENWYRKPPGGPPLDAASEDPLTVQKRWIGILWNLRNLLKRKKLHIYIQFMN